MIVIEKEEVEQKLTMPICIGLMRTAMADLASGRAFQPLRTIHVLPGGNLYAFMPAYLGENDYFGAKVLTQFKGNLGTGWPSHMGYVQICESVHGSTVGMVDADSITAIRTGAVSGLATDLLARKDCKTLAVIGCGVQGRGHLEAMLAVRPGIQTVRCYDLSAENAGRYAQEMSEKFKVPVTACKSVQEAVEDADIICTVTPSQEAYLKAEWVKPGCHINAVGTFSPTTREVTSELVAKSRLYADEVGALQKESGEYLIPLQEGLITEAHIVGAIGDVVNGKAPGRQNDEEITLFDALGQAIEDVVAAKYMIVEALKKCSC